MLREVVVDVETTGLDLERDRVIELAAIELIDRVPTGREFHSRFEPDGHPIGLGAFKVHGIRNMDLVEAPKFKDRAQEFLDFAGPSKIVAHGAFNFDWPMINAELKRAGLPEIPRERVVDTVDIAWEKHPDDRKSLDALCDLYSIDRRDRSLHGALIDARLLTRLYIKMDRHSRDFVTMRSEQMAERLPKLARLARLYRHTANDKAGHLVKAEGMTEAVIAYATEAIAYDVRGPTGRPLFNDRVQGCCESVSEVIDFDEAGGGHLAPGLHQSERRIALLTRAAESATFSPHHRSADETDDYEDIAKSLNRAAGISSTRSELVPSSPDSLDLQERPFTKVSAARLIEELGRLHQEIEDHLREGDPLISGGRDAIPRNRAAAQAEIGTLEKEVAAWKDPVVERVLQLHRERVVRAARYDPIFDGPPDAGIRDASPRLRPLSGDGTRSILGKRSREPDPATGGSPERPAQRARTQGRDRSRESAVAR